MAFLAGNTRVLAFKWVSGQLVIELLDRYFPVNQWKVSSVVFQVATHAILAIRILHLQLRVISAIVGEQLCNFFVAIEATKDRYFGSELVTTIAL